jgi:hypothetical protein
MRPASGTRDGSPQAGGGELAQREPLAAVMRAFAVLAALAAAAGCAGPRGGGARPGPFLDLLLSIPGEAREGELGFRFGPPRDTDGDGIADIAAGARFTDLELTQMGTVTVRSTDGGRELAWWEGHVEGGLFGHSVLAGPDADGDGLPDVVGAAPNGKLQDDYRGVLYTRSPVSGRLLWTLIGEPGEGLGWDLALAGDQDGDGVEDLFAGAPGGPGPGKAYLVSGRDGKVLRAFTSKAAGDEFGWYVAAAPDLDGDGRLDLAVGAPTAELVAAGNAGTSVPAGAAWVLSSASRRELHAWRGETPRGMFGEVVAGLPDLDGDGAGEVAVSAPHQGTGDEPWLPGEVFIFSGASGSLLHRWRGRRDGELYGRMVTSAGDIDGDGTGDVAVGVPWSRNGDRERAGRVELRSGRTGEVLEVLEGERPELWLGWHIERGEDLGPERRRGLVVSTIRSEENGLPAAGAIRVYVLR